jgi:uncharacterized protein (DUF952 family)
VSAVILHISPRATWEEAVVAGVYAADSLATEGYIHCSTLAQVAGPANYLFRGRTDLVLLQIDESKLPVAVTWEDGSPPSPDGQLFPHVYAPIPVTAVVAVTDYRPDADGSFSTPVL